MAKVRMAGLTFNAASAAMNGLARTVRLMPDPESFGKSLMQRKTPKRRFGWKT